MNDDLEDDDPYYEDYVAFAETVRNADMADSHGRVALDFGDGHVVYGSPTRLSRSVVYNKRDFQLLGQHQEYAFDVGGADAVEVSVQFYRSVSGWRLFAFVPPAGRTPLLFSVNVEKQQGFRAAGVITLSQKMVLANRPPKDADPVAKEAFKQHRKALTSQYRESIERLGLPVSEPSSKARSLDRVAKVRLAVFRPESKAFDRGAYGSSGELIDDHACPLKPQTVLRDFLRVALLKGHYSRNKGYRLDWL